MKTFLVTGASEGIGGAVCRRIVAAEDRHVRLVITTSGRRPAPASLIEEFEAAGADVTHLAGDLADPAVCAEIGRRAVEIGAGKLDGFVSNAGTTAPTPLDSIAVETWRIQLDQNLSATLFIAQAVKAALAAAKGSVVATSSIAGLQPFKNNGAYSVSKQALIMLCRNLAQEWASDGIRVNAVLPGMVRTPLTESNYRNEAVREARNAFVPLGRVAVPDDIAGPIVFLMSSAACYITGQALVVDGGLLDSTLNHMPGLPAKK